MFRLLFHFFNDLPICRQPVDASQFVFVEPLRSLMLLQFQQSALHVAEVAVHREMELRIVPFHRIHQSLHHDARLQLLQYLAFEGLFRRFPRFHLPARKLPPVLVVAISPLRGEDAPLLIVNNCCYNSNLFALLAFSFAVVN